MQWSVGDLRDFHASLTALHKNCKKKKRRSKREWNVNDEEVSEHKQLHT
jgi:hypothetical protein